MSTAYQPDPIATEAVDLPAGLSELVEQLAESVHDTWAARRLADGWVWGPKRDDDAKTHPSLVPYAELSESEKEYDRGTVVETIKGMLALGYEVSRPAD